MRMLVLLAAMVTNRMVHAETTKSCDQREIVISRTTSSDGWDGYVNMDSGSDANNVKHNTKNFISTKGLLIHAEGKQSKRTNSWRIFFFSIPDAVTSG